MSDLIQENVKTVPIADLVPTQVTVGMGEVEVNAGVGARNTVMMPYTTSTNIGFPSFWVLSNARHYLIDRHHLTLALYDGGICELPVSIVANMSGLSFEEFWKTLEVHNWTHPFDQGRRCSYDSMPASVDGLIDDPFRSLAGALKRTGGYAKDKAPFSEFRWANFLRRRIPRQLTEHHFGHALAVAMNFAHSAEAAVLPGWRRHPE
jgi:hypothetical protein